MATSILRRREPVLLLTIFAAASLLFDWYFVSAAGSQLATIVNAWGTTIFNFSIIVGSLALLESHLRTSMRRTPGRWIYSVMCVAMFVIYALVGWVTGRTGEAYDFLFYYVYQPGYIAWFGCLLFFVFIATWRTMRVRNFEAVLFIGAATITMLAYAPLAETIWTGWSPIHQWLQNVWMTSTFRGIQIGIAIGAITMGIRVLLGLERRYVT